MGKETGSSRVSDAQEISGHGVKVKIDGKMVLAGNGKLMDEEGISYTECDSIGTVVYVAEDGRFLGSIVIADGIKDGVKDAIQRLKRAGVSKTVMLTGDRRNVAEAVAKEIGLDEVHAQLLPGDKVDAVESLMKFLPESKNWLLLVMALMMHRCFPGRMWESLWEVWDRMRQSRLRMWCLWMMMKERSRIL